MFDGNTILNDTSYFFNSYGEPIRIQIYSMTIASGNTYDDDVSFTKSGNDVWTNGMIFPIANAKHGSAEAMLLEQGKLLSDDMSVYIPGNIDLSGAGVKIGFGSPVDEIRQVIYPGVENYQSVTYTTSYKKVYTRILTNGSFIGE